MNVNNSPASPEERESLVELTDPEFSPPQVKVDAPLKMVETAFLASTTSLLWLIDSYFHLVPLLRLFLSVPIALTYLRWGKRAAWMATLVSTLLLSVLVGPSRSVLFLMPYGLLGVLLGTTWRRNTPWIVSISLGALLGTLGFFFNLWLLSVLTGEDLWLYTITQMTEFAEWGFVKLGWLTQPSILLIQALAIASVLVSNTIYLFAVHLAAWLVLDRLGNPIPRPPRWVEVLMDYEG